jgi:NADH dehydrogenase/NADH:ubiquinone oxidoreductase subunit G
VPTVTIDGIKVEVEREATILDAAKKAGVFIPTLCFHPAVSSGANCRICMVELDRGDWKQMVTACNYPVRRDITVSVSSEKAVRARQGVMKLLLARAPECEELKELAHRMGVDSTPYPTVTESQRNCILCGLCTRVCEEVMGVAGIGFAGRGVQKSVAAPFRQPPENCIACGACAMVCPVGTIRIRHHEDTGEIEISPFKARVKMLKCEECGRPVVAEPIAKEVLSRIKIDWAEFRKRVRLCSACRRKHAAEALAMVEAKKNP